MTTYLHSNSNGNKTKRRIYPSLFSNPLLSRYEEEPEGYRQTYDPYGVNTNPTFSFGEQPEGFAAVETPFPKTLQDAAGNLNPRLATRAALGGIYAVRGILWAKRKVERTAKKLINKWKGRKGTYTVSADGEYEKYEEWCKRADADMKASGWTGLKPEPLKKSAMLPEGYAPLGDVYNAQRLGSFEAEPGLAGFKSEPSSSMVSGLRELQRLLGTKIVTGLSPEILKEIAAKMDKKGPLSDYLKGGILPEDACVPQALPKPDPNNDLNNSLIMDVPEENKEAAEKIDPESNSETSESDSTDA